MTTEVFVDLSQGFTSLFQGFALVHSAAALSFQLAGGVVLAQRAWIACILI
jgi:hypothetical protein